MIEPNVEVEKILNTPSADVNGQGDMKIGTAYEDRNEKGGDPNRSDGYPVHARRDAMTDPWFVACLVWMAVGMGSFAQGTRYYLLNRQWDLWYARTHPGTWLRVPVGRMDRWLKLVEP